MTRAPLAVVLVLGLASCGGGGPSYDGPGRDHALVGRSTEEFVDCDGQRCLPMRRSQQVVQVVWEDGPVVADAACLPGRLQVAVEDGLIIAAYESGC